MNITLIAAEIARRIPDMAKDCATNNEALIKGLLEAEIQQCKQSLDGEQMKSI